MKNISEYDERQLRLMHDILIGFEGNRIGLSGLVGSLEFLLNALEAIDENWEEKFLKEIAVLETANALEIIRDSGEKVPEIGEEQKKIAINAAILNLKNLVIESLSK